MKKILLIMALATMTIVVNAQNKVTSVKAAPEMVYYYTDFSIVRMKDSTRKKMYMFLILEMIQMGK